MRNTSKLTWRKIRATFRSKSNERDEGEKGLKQLALWKTAWIVQLLLLPRVVRARLRGSVPMCGESRHRHRHHHCVSGASRHRWRTGNKLGRQQKKVCSVRHNHRILRRQCFRLQ